MGRGREGVVVKTEDGTDVISDDDDDNAADERLERVADNAEEVDKDEDDDDDDDDTVGAKDNEGAVEEVIDDGTECANDNETDDRVGNDEVKEELEREGTLETEEEFDVANEPMAMQVFVTATDMEEALLVRLASEIFVGLSTLLFGINEGLTLGPREMPELPGVTGEFSSSRSTLELATLPPGGFTPGGRPVRFFSLGSLDSLSSSEFPVSSGTGRYGGMVLTWLPFLCWCNNMLKSPV